MLNIIVKSACALVLAVCLIAASGFTAQAGPFEDAIAKFINDSFSDTEAAIGTLASSNNTQALPVISALQSGRLLADSASKQVFVKLQDGKITDAATGAPVASAPASASVVRLNNRLRRIIDAAVA